MDALKVRVSRVVACLNQRLEAGLHQSANAAAENCLLAEEVGLGLGTERGLQNACSCAADTECICEADVPSVARCILLDRDEARYALACLILTSDRVTRALRRDHDDVDVLRRLDAAEVNVKAVCKCQGLALGQVRLNALFVQCSLLFIVDENHDDVRSLCSLGACHDLEALCLGLCPALGAFIQTDNNVNAAVLQVQCMCVTLRAVADDGNGLACELLQIAILLIKNSCHDKLPLSVHELVC